MGPLAEQMLLRQKLHTTERGPWTGLDWANPAAVTSTAWTSILGQVFYKMWFILFLIITLEK